MNKLELIKYWEETSDKDYITMQHLYNSGDYHWSLFIGHIVIEKLLKACYVKFNDYKQAFYRKCTKEYTEANVKKIEGVRVWLKKMING